MDPALALVRTALNSTSHLAPRAAGRAAFELWRHPLRRSALRPDEREIHRQAAVDELTVNGKRVQVYRWGDGARPVLLMHGWRSRASRFAGYVLRLRALGLTPVAFDAPGHGASGGRATTVLEYREIARQLQLRYGNFEAIVAHSLGVLGAFLALREGVRAERLVSLAGVSEFTYLPRAFCAGLGLNAAVERDLRHRIEHDLFAGTENPWQHFDAAHRPQEIDVRILVVHDENDDVVGLDHAHRLKAAYGDRLDLLVTRGLGHRRIVTEPTVLDNVVGFVAAGREIVT
ncbi:alpha/beta hydrolase [Kitasatospora aureofaciens]|uniref:alpha/beta hydrolase n=1 Tax=Kitasatospora aureofaciens TaxID=1894 RepID=UPI001C47B234|nr:alpha/beta hydrolase [Kitasatospora aureofaciens]MBV6700622.1 alpha/beta hydrolase [Kitasatospora aureofaciens]